jgi:predicted TIM-barrel fold metal-dependent hydrolase
MDDKSTTPLIERCPLASSDSHILEPADLWSTRVDAAFRDRAPKVVHVDESQEWHADGIRFHTVRATGYQAGVRFSRPEDLSLNGRLEDIRAGGMDPHAHVQDMDLDGVAATVLYPTVGLQLYRVADTNLFSACVRAYNDHVADFCKPYPQRLKGIALLNVDNIRETVEELERAAKMGLAGALIPVRPYVRYDHPGYEPLWTAAQRLDMPLTLHIGTERWRPDIGIPGAPLDAVVFSAGGQDLRLSVAALIFGGVFERFPGLKVIAAEFEISWALYLMNRMDDTYKNRVAGLKGRRFEGSVIPSDFFRRNMYISFQEDAMGIEARYHIGVDHLMWGADYPHAESTFPRSREIIDEIFKGLPTEEKAKITRDNAVRLYGFSIEGAS